MTWYGRSLGTLNSYEEVRRGDDALALLDRELRILAHRFQDLRKKEHEGWDGFQTYDTLREWDAIAPEDRPFPEEADRLRAALPEWCELYVGVGEEYEDLARLLCPEGSETSGALEARILSNLAKLGELGSAFSEAPTGPLLHRLKGHVDTPQPDGSRGEELVTRLLTWLGGDARALVEASMPADVVLEPLLAWGRAAKLASPDTLAGIEERARRLALRFEAEQVRIDDLPPLDNARMVAQLREASEILKQASGGFFRWHMSPSARRARKMVAALLGQIPERSGTVRWSADVSAAIDRFDAQRRLSDLTEEIEAYVPEKTGLEAPGPGRGTRADWLTTVRRARATATVLRLVRGAPAEQWVGIARLVLDPDEAVLNRTTVPRVEAVLKALAATYQRERLLQALKEETPLHSQWRETLHPLLADLHAGVISNEGAAALRRLEALLPNAPKFRRLRDLERGELASIPRTLEGLRATLANGGEVPEWVRSHVHDALSAHRLSWLIRGSLGADPDDVASVTAALRKGQKKRLGLISALVERRHRLRQAKALLEGNTRAELQRVKRLLRMSGRMKNSLVTLRRDIDYGAVLRAFPAWLATIDDACRLFPATSELFDYVIVDEASQCAQPALLPLAFRCRNLIVVGDRKQLRPTFARFLPRTAIEALQAKHGLSEHRAGIFAEGGDSLLDFAEYRANHRGFLDEHFRCDPAIIAWSNARHYGNRLKVLTHRRPNNFVPALEIRRLQETDDDTERKVNQGEAEAVVRELRRLTSNPRNAGLSMGAISPFRAQADLIQGLIDREFEADPQAIREHRLLASTADGFQGDERDIILYSFRVGPSSNPNSLGVLEREEERFNVAFSRARRLAISFLSTRTDRLPSAGVTRSWCTGPRNLGEIVPRCGRKIMEVSAWRGVSIDRAGVVGIQGWGRSVPGAV